MPGPDSSYSCFEHHMFWKVLRDAKIEPPIHTEYFRSGGATILIYHFDNVSSKAHDSSNRTIQTFMPDGDREVSSFCMRSAIPGNMVVPPERTTLP